MIAYNLPWMRPLDFARSFAAGDPLAAHDWVFLYSGTSEGRYSYLAAHPAEHAIGSDWLALASLLTTDQRCFQNAWFGHLSYGLLRALEPRLPQEGPGYITLPELWFTRYRLIYVFDHVQETMTAHTEPGEAMPSFPGLAYLTTSFPRITALASSFSREEYLEAAQAAIEAIHAGAFYQANLTRKFYGYFESAPEPFALFDALAAKNPAPYSAFMKRGDTAIISSSPECFLSLLPNGLAESRPIKGTARRNLDNPKADREAAHTLQESAKDRAENLMIVDLVRNDLAKSCEANSIHVRELCALKSYATVHHLVSTVEGFRRANATPLSLVAGCFPPGSMTGAPKYRVMHWCTEQERMARGVYSGALGFFGGDGSAELSVTIRTLLVEGDRFEFQVGGGIVADSTPEGEWQETLAKAQAIAELLGINAEKIASL